MAYQKLRFTDEQIAIANSVNILDYAKNTGYPLKQISRSSFKVPKYGGLYINADGHKWYWFTRDKGGGAIQFVMEMEQKTWVEAVKTLLGLYIDVSKHQPDNKLTQEEKVEMVLPEKNNTYKHVIAYLIQTRKIDKDIVYDSIKERKIYENKYRSCVFVGYDKEGIPRYASYRSTNTKGKTYRGDVKNSDKSFPFCVEGNNDIVNVFESPIDLMSYLTLLKINNISDFNNHCISLGCVADLALEKYLKDNPNINKIVVCLDNDKAGRFGYEKIKEGYEEKYMVCSHFPKGKDFNEDLVSLVNKMITIKQKEVIENRNDDREYTIEGK
jgi:hypothetical protein